MSRTEIATFTTMCMVRDGDRVLVLDRKDPDWPGVTFPGGHVEPNESFVDCAIREVWEETGLTISAPRLCGVKDWYSDGERYVVLFFQTDRFSGQLQFSAEGEVWWEELCKFHTMPLADGMDSMLRVFLSDDLSEFFYRQDGDHWVQELK